MTTALLAMAGSVFADPSLECSTQSSSQVETGQCLEVIETRVDAALEIALRFAQDSARELDQVTEQDNAVPALEASQNAWETYRSNHCDYRGALFGGGSGTGIEIRSCRIELTRARTEELMALLP